MTAINVICMSDRVHVISDGAAINADGRLQHLISKTAVLPHLQAVVAVRGVRAMGSAVVDSLGAGVSSFDELRSRGVSITRRMVDTVAAPWSSQFGDEVLNAEIIVAGWSETRGPAAFIFGTSDLNASHGLPAWRAVDVDMLLTPTNAQVDAEFAGLLVEFSDERAVALVARQRGIQTRALGGRPGLAPRGVGGFVQVSTVSQARIESRVVKRFDDKIGHPIGAAA